MPRALILGTGTGVGKTYFTVALARTLRQRGAVVHARKPIETGIPATRRSAPATDAAALDAASTRAASAQHPLYGFRDPVSQHLASLEVGVRISVPRIRRWLDADRSDMTTHVMSWQLVETAGGLLSPLSRRATNLDLALALEPALWILVAHDGLCVLHDVRATLLALGSVTKRKPDYLVLCASRPADLSTGTNARELARLGLPRPIAVLSARGDAASELQPLARALEKAAR